MSDKLLLHSIQLITCRLVRFNLAAKFTVYTFRFSAAKNDGRKRYKSSENSKYTFGGTYCITVRCIFNSIGFRDHQSIDTNSARVFSLLAVCVV